MDVRIGPERWLSAEELRLLNCGVGEDSWESLALQADQTSPSSRKLILTVYWKDWCWSSNTLATWCKKLTHWKRLWYWERLKAGGEGGNRGWDNWMASPTRWTWVWPSSGRWWRTGKPGVLWSMGSQRVGHDWATEQQEYLTTYNTLRYFLFSSVLSIGYQCIPCWLWYSLEKSALILISNTYLARSECDLHSQKILPGYGCALFRYWRGWVASTMDVSHAGSHTTSVWWQSFILFHSASFVPVSCLVAECHGSLWGNGWVILWME